VPDILYQIQEALAGRYSIKRELGKELRPLRCAQGDNKADDASSKMARSGHAHP
jgi:hypothetical protein